MLEKRDLGRTGFQVTEIGFGAWPIGGGQTHYGLVPEEQAHGCIAAYLQQGGNLIDTARWYGESERLLGDYLRHNGGREETVIISKTIQLEAPRIRKELEETLRLLHSDSVDVYLLHNPPDDPGQMHRVLDVYEQLKAEGKIRAIGASIKGPDVTQHTVDLCKQYIRSGRVDVLMIVYSILRQKNEEIFQEAHESGVGILARTVLESGFLTGKYKPGHTFTGQDHRIRWGKERLRSVLEYVQELERLAVAPPYETVSQLAIRFALDRAEISSVVVGQKPRSK